MSVENKKYASLKRTERLIDRCLRCRKGAMIVDVSGGEISAATVDTLSRKSSRNQVQNGVRFPQKKGMNERARDLRSSLAMHDMGLATVIGIVDRDASGKSLSASMKATIERLRTWDGRSQVHESEDRNRRQAFSDFYRMVDKLNVNDAVIRKAAYIYRKALERGIIAAVLYQQ